MFQTALILYNVEKKAHWLTCDHSVHPVLHIWSNSQRQIKPSEPRKQNKNNSFPSDLTLIHLPQQTGASRSHIYSFLPTIFCRPCIETDLIRMCLGGQHSFPQKRCITTQI